MALLYAASRRLGRRFDKIVEDVLQADAQSVQNRRRDTQTSKMTADVVGGEHEKVFGLHRGLPDTEAGEAIPVRLAGVAMDHAVGPSSGGADRFGIARVERAAAPRRNL